MAQLLETDLARCPFSQEDYDRCDTPSKRVAKDILAGLGYTARFGGGEDLGRDLKVRKTRYALELTCRINQWSEDEGHTIFPRSDFNIERAKATRNWLWRTEWRTDYLAFNKEFTWFGLALHEDIVPFALPSNTFNLPNVRSNYKPEPFIKVPTDTFYFFHLIGDSWELRRDRLPVDVDNKLKRFAKKYHDKLWTPMYRPEKDAYALLVIEEGDHPPRS